MPKHRRKRGESIAQERKRLKHGSHTESEKKVARAMSEVHRSEPSTVTRARKFGPGGKEAMLKAIALDKARDAGARIPKKRKKK